MLTRRVTRAGVFMNSLWSLERFLTDSGPTIDLVLDLLFVAIVVVFFIVSAGYVVACERLMK